MKRRLLITAVAAAAVLAGCGSSSSKSASTSAPTQTQSQVPVANVQHYKVSFVQPTSRAAAGSTFTAKVKLKNFKIAPKAVGQAPKAGEGHLHFMLDGGRYDYPKYSGPNGTLGKSLGVNGRYSPALAPTITYRHIPPGKHTLGVILANNNHTPTGVTATSDFTVR
jgi:hypothetical protein